MATAIKTLVTDSPALTAMYHRCTNGCLVHKGRKVLQAKYSSRLVDLASLYCMVGRAVA